MHKDKRLAYWRANLRLVGLCLLAWFAVSFGFGVLFVEPLNTIRFGGFQLGFWFAQQGSIYFFVVLIFAYTAPAIFIAIQITGHPIPQLAFGSEATGSGTVLLDKLNDIVTCLGFNQYTSGTKGIGVFGMCLILSSQ